MNKNRIVCLLIVMSLVPAACSPRAAAEPTATPQAALPASTSGGPATAAPDLCTKANLPETVKLVNTYVYQFDNYAALATTVTQSQLPQLLSTMQSIRQAAQQQAVPPCLTDLKHYALLYMDTAIQTLESFHLKPDINTLNAGIMQARTYNDQYSLELARLLGVTLAAPSPMAGTQAAGQPAETATAVVVMVLNPGPNPLNLHVSPSLTSQSIGVLNAGQTAKAVGKSSNGEWVQIEVPGQAGQRAWVYASLVQYVNGDAGVLPVATP